MHVGPQFHKSLPPFNQHQVLWVIYDKIWSYDIGHAQFLSINSMVQENK